MYYIDWKYLNKAFTAAGGEALTEYWYHTSSEISAITTVTITFDRNGSNPPANKYALTDMDNKGVENVRSFIHF